MKMKSLIGFFLCMCAVLFTMTPLLAQEKALELKNAQKQVQKKDGWTFVLMPAVAFVGMKGKAGLDYDSGNFDLSPGEFRSSTKSAYGMAAAAIKDRHTISLAGSYVKLNDDVPVVLGSTGTFRDTTLEMTTVEADYSYRFLDRQRYSLEAMGGLRYWNLNYQGENFSYVPGYPLRTTQVANWLDPVVGMKMIVRVTPKFSIPLRLDMGGFGLGSEFTSSGRAGVSYRFHPRVSGELGYTYTYVNYRQRGTVFDVTLYGPYIGLGLIF